jgi:hypothetical protein
MIAIAVGKERVSCFADLEADGALVADGHVTRLNMLVHASNRATVDLKSIQTFVFLYHY